MSDNTQHHCHWPGCNTPVPPKMWGCSKHWFRLPKDIRNAIWRTYKPGQEETKNPSPEYIQAALHAKEWIKHHQSLLVNAETLFENVT